MTIRRGRPPMPAIERFWAMVDKSGEHWLWTGYLSNGYGSILVDGKAERVHRYSWTVHNGPIPDGIDVLHKCDIRNCVKPDCLFLGTDLDNIRDMIAKGRSVNVTGEKHGMAKLTESDVKELRRLYAANVGPTRIAKRFPISKSQIWNIVRGKSWTKLD